MRHYEGFVKRGPHPWPHPDVGIQVVPWGARRGKGTQGRRLAMDRGWALISTGDMLRDAIAKRTPLGSEARKLIDQGLLVPDPVMIGLVRERTLERDAREGFVLDGFPRTVSQAALTPS